MTTGASSIAATPASPVVIRRYNPSDRAAIREICRQAASEQPNPLFHEDRDLAPMLLVDYYLEYEPQSCFVAEADQKVVGYLAGCMDTASYLKIRRRRVLPRAVLRILWRLITLRYRRKTTYKVLWWSLLNHLRPQRGKATFPLSQFPAHSHFNVAPDFRGQGIGFRLGVEYHDYLRAQGVKGLHAMSIEKAGDERISKYLCKKRGYQLATTQAHPLLEKVTGQKYVLQVVICDLEEEARNAEPQSDYPP